MEQGNLGQVESLTQLYVTSEAEHPPITAGVIIIIPAASKRQEEEDEVGVKAGLYGPALLELLLEQTLVLIRNCVLYFYSILLHFHSQISAPHCINHGQNSPCHHLGLYTHVYTEYKFRSVQWRQSKMPLLYYPCFVKLCEGLNFSIQNKIIGLLCGFKCPPIT